MPIEFLFRFNILIFINFFKYKNDFAYVLQFFSLISVSLGSVSQKYTKVENFMKIFQLSDTQCKAFCYYVAAKEAVEDYSACSTLAGISFYLQSLGFPQNHNGILRPGPIRQVVQSRRNLFHFGGSRIYMRDVSEGFG